MNIFIKIITLLLLSLRLPACDCEKPNSALEFYNSKYVFEGTVTSKAYTQDFQNYTITFSISKHYKNSTAPKLLSFVLDAEEEYTDKSSSCDWSVNLNEKWLVYAHLGNDGILYFNGICSNSRRIGTYDIPESEQVKLDNGNKFKIEDYIYHEENGFTNSKPKTSIDSILKNAEIKNYKNNFTIIKLYIDEKGELQGVSNAKQFNLIYDSIFKMPTKFVNKEIDATNDFEKNALYVSSKIKKWEIKYHKRSRTPVRYIKSIIFTYNKEKKSWSYEF